MTGKILRIYFISSNEVGHWSEEDSAHVNKPRFKEKLQKRLIMASIWRCCLRDNPKARKNRNVF